MTGTLGLRFVTRRTLALEFQCVDFCVNTSFGMPSGTESFNMVKLGDHSEVNEDNYVPVPEDKLKEDQKQEYLELVDRFKRKCLKSYSVTRSGDVIKNFNLTRSGDVIKNFNLPFFHVLIEVQRENKMIDAVGQAVAQAFVKSAIVMGNTVHNAVVKTFTWVLVIYS